MPVKIIGPPGATTGTGSVGGPATSTDNAIARFDGTGGKTLQNSSTTIDDSGNLAANNFKAAANYFIGATAGNGTISGTNNVSAGTNALVAATTAGQNVTIGLSAGKAITTSSFNVILGSGAGERITTGAGTNVIIGYQAGTAATTMEQAVFIGRNAGLSTTTGIANTAVGESAGYKLTTGMDNTFVGSDAGYSGNDTGGVTSGSHNTCVGNNAGESGTAPTFDDVTGSDNTAIGHGAGWSGGTASFQTAIGSGAKCTADNQVTIGRAADSINVPGSGNIPVGKKYTLGFAPLQAAGNVTSLAVSMATLPANSIMTGVCLELTTPFANAGATFLTASLGTAGDHTAFSATIDLLGAGTTLLLTDQFKATDLSAMAVKVYIETDDRLDNIDSAGSLSIYPVYIVLPSTGTALT